MSDAPLPRSSVNPAPGLAAKLTALPEFGFRLGWLGDYAARAGPEPLALALDELSSQALTGAPRAREALVAAAVFLATRHSSPLLGALRDVARQHALLALDRLVRIGPEPTESELDLPMPRYSERELTLGERRSMARRPTRLQIEKLLVDPDALVLEQLLQCPGLTETDVLSVATNRSRRGAAFDILVASARWIARPRIRHAIVQNPRAPHSLALPLVSTLLREDMIVVERTTTVNPVLRMVAQELLERLPPLGEGPGDDSDTRITH
jgi:hypothetical protein